MRKLLTLLPPTLAVISLLGTSPAQGESLAERETADNYNSVFDNEISDKSKSAGGELLELGRENPLCDTRHPTASPTLFTTGEATTCAVHTSFAKSGGLDTLIAQALPAVQAPLPHTQPWYQRLFKSKPWRHIRHFCVQIGPVLSVICMLLPLVLLLI